MKYAVFEWLDAEVSSGWDAYGEFVPASNPIAAGFVVYESAEWFVVAATVDTENAHANAVLTVPRGMIKLPFLYYGDFDVLLKKAGGN